MNENRGEGPAPRPAARANRGDPARLRTRPVAGGLKKKCLLKGKAMESDSSSVSPRVLRRRMAVQRWKDKNREYYLRQKRELSRLPEYKARRREMYMEKRVELIAYGLAPRPLGRPRLYDGEEALEARRQTNRAASARWRLKQKSSRLVRSKG